MPAAYPEEFRRRAVSLVVDEGVPAARVAKDLGIAESGLRRWVDHITPDPRQSLLRHNDILPVDDPLSL